MGHKTHLVGFRLSVPSRGSRVPRYHPTEDLLGNQSTWWKKSKDAYSSLLRRDREIRKRMREKLQREGYVRNRCTIQRSALYVGVYVDAYRLEDVNLVTGLYGAGLKRDIDEVAVSGGEVEAAAAAPGPSGFYLYTPSSLEEGGGGGGAVCVPVAASQGPGRGELETLLSDHVEKGKPVVIQRLCLNELLRDIPTSQWEHLSKALPRGQARQSKSYGQDLRNVVQLLGLVPCAPVLATVVSLRLSGGRLQRTAYRLVQSLRKAHSESHYGLRTLRRWRSQLPDTPARVPGSNSKAWGAWSQQRVESRKRGPLLPSLIGQRAVFAAGHGHGHNHGQVPAVGAGAESQERVDVQVQAPEENVVFGGYRGYRIRFKGRVAGSERSRKVLRRGGSIPRQRMSAPVDYSRAESLSPTGKVSVSVAVCYG